MNSPANLPAPSAAARTTRPWNALAAFVLLLLSGWTLIADLAHDAHFVLQPSLSSVFLGLFVTGWMIAAVIFAVFPKRYLIPAVALVMARASFGWPLVYALDLRTASILLDGLLLLIALVFLIDSMKSTAMYARLWFRWQHSLAMGVVTLLASILALPVGILGVTKLIKDISSGYVHLTPGGLELTERVFEKDGRRVHLAGMAHIADVDFYEGLNANLAEPIEGRRLVLLEGVSDHDKILPQSFASGETYRAMAEKLGLAEQAIGFAMQSDKNGESLNTLEAWTERGIDFRRADIDVSELEPEHRDHLVTLLGAMENLNLESLFTMPGDMTAKDLENLMVEGLVKKRNSRLMEVFAEHEIDYAEVFIPWGAAHLPDLERRFVALGYAPVRENRRLGIDFWKGFRRTP